MERRGTWIRYYLSTLENPKIMQMSHADIGGWSLLLLVAERDGDSGILPDPDAVAFAMRSWSEDEIVALLERLVERGLVDKVPGGKRGVRFRLHDWEFWQADSRTYRETLTKPPTRARAASVSANANVDVNPSLALPRVREQSGDLDPQNPQKQEPQRPIAEQTEPPVRPINGNGEDTIGVPYSAPPSPPPLDDSASKRFQETWKTYWGIPGNPNSSKTRAWEIFKELSEEDQTDAAIGVVRWRLELNGASSGFATPDPTRKTKIKFLETWLADEQWKQFNAG